MPAVCPNDEATRAARMPSKERVSRLVEQNRTSPLMGEPDRAQRGMKSSHTLLEACQQARRLTTTNVNGTPLTPVIERKETTSKDDSIVGEAPPQIGQINCVEGFCLAEAYSFELVSPQWLGGQGESKLGLSTSCQPTEVKRIAVGREKNLMRAHLQLPARKAERRSPRQNAVRPYTHSQFGRLVEADRENLR